MFFHADGWIPVDTPQLHMTFHISLTYACYGAQTQTTEGCVSNVHTSTHRTVYTYTHTHTQMQTRIDESICCINTTNTLTGVQRITLTQKDAQWCVSGQSNGTQWLSYADTHTRWLAPMGEAIGPPVWLLSPTSTSFLCKQTPAVWNIKELLQKFTLRELFYFNWFFILWFSEQKQPKRAEIPFYGCINRAKKKVSFIDTMT